QCVAHLEPTTPSSPARSLCRPRGRPLSRSHPLDPRTRKLLPAQESPAQSLSRQVRLRSRAGFSEWSAQLPCRSEAAGKSQDLRRLATTTVSRKVGSVLEASLRWPRLCAALSRPLHPSRGHLQPPPGLLCRRHWATLAQLVEVSDS